MRQSLQQRLTIMCSLSRFQFNEVKIILVCANCCTLASATRYTIDSNFIPQIVVKSPQYSKISRYKNDLNFIEFEPRYATHYGRSLLEGAIHIITI